MKKKKLFKTLTKTTAFLITITFYGCVAAEACSRLFC